MEYEINQNRLNEVVIKFLENYFKNEEINYFHPYDYFVDEEGKSNLHLSSKWERKFYASKEDELFTDLQKVLALDEWWKDKDFEIVLLHECDGITKVRITADTIQMFEPQDWEEVDHITHSYCYGCSTPKSTKSKENR
jgi:hypothetical protein